MTDSLLRVAARHLPVRLRSRLSAALRGGRVTMGTRSWIHPRAQVIGKRFVAIGSNSCIGSGSWLNVNDRRPDAAGIRIGSNCFIGRDNFFSSGRSIELGDFCLTTVGCRFVSSSHVVEDPWRPTLSTGTTATDAIVIGANCFFGVGSTVIGNVRIGHGSVIGACAVVVGDLPPFSMAIGNPARVLRRYSFSLRSWILADGADDSAFSEQPTESTYLAGLRREPPVHMPWIAAGADMGDL